MELLLLRDVRKLGHVGDVVKVRPGYGRNFLLPQRAATWPTEEAIKAIQAIKVKAAAQRAEQAREFKKIVEDLKDVQVTIEAAANPEGTLYGSVGAKDIAKALQALGHAVSADHVMLDVPIRSLDNRTIKLEFSDEVSTSVKLWVVREGGEGDGDSDEQPESGSKPEPAADAKAE